MRKSTIAAKLGVRERKPGVEASNTPPRWHPFAAAKL